MKNLTKSVLAIAICALSLSCSVDKDYRILSDGLDLDMTVQLLPGIKIPIGSLAPITLGDIIDLEENEYVKDVDGVYWFNIEGTDISYDFTVPDMTFTPGKQGDRVLFNTVNMPYIPNIPNLDLSEFIEDLTLPIDNGLDFSFTVDFPAEVKELESVTTDAQLNVTLRYGADIPFKYLYIVKDTEIILPVWVKLSSCTTDGFTLVDGRKLIATKDVKISKNETFSIGCRFDGIRDIPEGQGIVTPGRFTLGGGLDFNGYFKLPVDALELPIASGRLEVDVECCFDPGTVRVVNARARLDVAPALDNQDIDIDGLPDFLDGGDVVLDLNDIYAYLSVDNRFPLGFSLSADMRTYKTGALTHQYSISNLSFASGEKRTTVFCEKGYDGNDAVEYRLPGFGSLLSPIPDNVKIDGMQASLADEMVTVEAGAQYGIAAKLQIRTPLVFGPGAKVNLSETIDGLEFNTSEEMKMDTIEMTMEVVNSIPLDLAIEPVAVDENGEPSSGMAIKMSGSVKGGTVQNPSVNKISFSMSSTGEMGGCKGIKLNISAASSESLAGKGIGKDQGMQFRNICISLPEGITLNLASDKGNNENVEE